MKRIKLFPSPHTELRIFVSEEMERDFKKCAEEAKGYVKDATMTCSECSWRDCRINGEIVCELVTQEILEGAKV